MHQGGERGPQPPGVHGEPGHAAAHHAQLRRQSHRPRSRAPQQAGDRPVPPAPGPGRQHLADHPGLIQPPEQHLRRRQHMRHPAPRRLAPSAAKPVGDLPGRLLLPGRTRLEQHHPPVRAARPPGKAPSRARPAPPSRTPGTPAAGPPSCRSSRSRSPATVNIGVTIRAPHDGPPGTQPNDQGGPSSPARHPHPTVATPARASRDSNLKIVTTAVTETPDQLPIQNVA